MFDNDLFFRMISVKKMSIYWRGSFLLDWWMLTQTISTIWKCIETCMADEWPKKWQKVKNKNILSRMTGCYAVVSGRVDAFVLTSDQGSIFSAVSLDTTKWSSFIQILNVNELKACTKLRLGQRWKQWWIRNKGAEHEYGNLTASSII